MTDDALPGRILEKITGLNRDTFRSWKSDGLLHSIMRRWRGKEENLYDLAEVRKVLVEKALTSEKAKCALSKLDVFIGWMEEQVSEYLGRQQYTTSVNFKLISGVAYLALRLLPAPAKPPATSPTPAPALVTVVAQPRPPAPAPVAVVAQPRPPAPAPVAVAPVRAERKVRWGYWDSCMVVIIVLCVIVLIVGAFVVVIILWKGL